MACLCCAEWHLSLLWEYRVATGAFGGAVKEGEPGVVYRSFRTREGFVGGIWIQEFTWEGPIQSIDGEPELGSFQLENEYAVLEGGPPAGPYGDTESLEDFPGEVRDALEGKEWKAIDIDSPFAFNSFFGTFGSPLRVPELVHESVAPGTVAGCQIDDTGTSVLVAQSRFLVSKGGHYTPAKLIYTRDGEQADITLTKGQTEIDPVVFAVPTNNEGLERVVISDITLICPPWG